jgi:hypothetical protein
MWIFEIVLIRLAAPTRWPLANGRLRRRPFHFRPARRGSQSSTGRYPCQPAPDSQGADTYGFAYNGLADRLRQTLNSVPLHFALGRAAELTQVLADGTNIYT